jgi:hypothetical protein
MCGMCCLVICQQERGVTVLSLSLILRVFKIVSVFTKHATQADQVSETAARGPAVLQLAA